MNRVKISTVLFSILILLLPAAAADEGGAVRTRPSRDSVDRPKVRKPVPLPVPETLVPAKLPVPQPVDPDRHQDRILARADHAARWAAEELSRTRGWVEYYRSGWFHGITLALEDRSLGEWDLVQGFEIGSRDREARRIGLDIGLSQAEQLAVQEAAEQVESQFQDLGLDPRFEPRSVAPPFQAEGVFADRPDVEEFFLRFPVLSIAPFQNRRRRDRFQRGFGDWDVSPRQLRQMNRLEQYHDRDWSDPGAAFRFWKRNSGQAQIFLGLENPGRDLFRERFQESFAAWIPEFYMSYGEPAFASGFDDGWEYGAWMQYEISFQEGFADGFDHAVRSAAESSFIRNWDGAFIRAYEASFDHWMHSVRPAIVDLRLEDGDRDGVFGPGEELELFYTVANLGGGFGELEISLDGEVLVQPVPGTVRFEGRGRVDGSEPLLARIGTDVPVRTRGTLVLDLAGAQASAELIIARPLQFEDSWQVDSDDALQGGTVVEVQVVNRSRRPVTGSLGIVESPGYDLRETRDLGTMAAGEIRTVRFRLDGIDSLDILSGTLRIGFQVFDTAVVHDGLEARFPNLAVDLANDDLVTLVLRFATDRSVPRKDVDRALALMLERMRADWRITIRGRKNPYKQDYRARSDETAMGELVLRRSEMRGAVVRPEIFDDLRNDLTTLSRDLPGAHPLLRRWFRKLAARL